MRIPVEWVRVSGQSYRARCLSLPGCAVVAQSPEEARNKIDDAVRGYLAGLGATVPARLELDPPGYVSEVQRERAEARGMLAPA
jgi:predicted RNase H-like HicB family nuclease